MEIAREIKETKTRLQGGHSLNEQERTWYDMGVRQACDDIACKLAMSGEGWTVESAKAFLFDAGFNHYR